MATVASVACCGRTGRLSEIVPADHGPDGWVGADQVPARGEREAADRDGGDVLDVLEDARLDGAGAERRHRRVGAARPQLHDPGATGGRWLREQQLQQGADHERPHLARPAARNRFKRNGRTGAPTERVHCRRAGARPSARRRLLPSAVDRYSDQSRTIMIQGLRRPPGRLMSLTAPGPASVSQASHYHTTRSAAYVLKRDSANDITITQMFITLAIMLEVY